MVDQKHQKEIIRHLSEVFPGVTIYYLGSSAKKYDAEGKEPEIDIALDLGRRIGDKDLLAAQQGLEQSHIPYTIYLFDLQAMNDAQRKERMAKATTWGSPL